MRTTTIDFSSSRDFTYIRKVYGWLLAGLLVTSATAWAALNVGTPVVETFDHETILVPPMVEVVLEHPYLAGFLFLGFAIFAMIARKAQLSSVSAYLFFTAFSGLFIGPCLFAAQWDAAHHVTLSAHPIRDTFILTMGAFCGLTTYVWRTGKDFSFLGGTLYTGLWVVIIAGLLAMFLGSNSLSLAVASVSSIVFMGYILYDTSRVLQKSRYDDPIGDAMALYLDVLNLFLDLLRILATRSRD